MLTLITLVCLLLGPDTFTAQDVPDNTLLILKFAVDDVINSFEKDISDKLSLSDMKVQDGTITLKGGNISNLKSLKKTGEVETEKMDDGSYMFSVIYSLGSLDVTFDDFKYSYGWFSKGGKLVSSFKTDSSLTLELSIPPLSQAMAEYGKGKCFIYVKSLDLRSPKLTIERVYTGGVTGGRATTWALPMVSKGLEGTIQKAVGKALQGQITNFIPSKASKSICVTEENADYN